jgi:hypothetical protein
MKKLAAMSFDVVDLVTSGNLNELAEITKGQDELVKNAHVPTIDEVNKMPNDNFALVIYDADLGFIKKLATYDKYITQLNLDIFKTRTQEFPNELVKVASTFLQKAAKFYRLGFPDELVSYIDETLTSNIIDSKSINQMDWSSKQALLVKEASTEVVYALPSKKRYPLTDETMVKRAMDYFQQHYSEFTPQMRLEFGLNVKLAADSLNISPTALGKYATLTGTLNPDFTLHINTRKFYVSEENIKLYDALDPALGLSKTAAKLEELDIQFGLDKFWTRTIEDPYLSVFGIKKADINFTEYAGKRITSSTLSSVNLDFLDEDTIKDLRGDEAIAVFDSLPRPIKEKITNSL